MALTQQQQLLTNCVAELVNGINRNYHTLVSRLLSENVISVEDNRKVSSHCSRYIHVTIDIQWNNLLFEQDARTANLELINIIKHGGPRAFGVFYNALVLSDNTNVAKQLRTLIDNKELVVIDGYELYRPAVRFV
jgi:hypothetical protein